MYNGKQIPLLPTKCRKTHRLIFFTGGVPIPYPLIMSNKSLCICSSILAEANNPVLSMNVTIYWTSHLKLSFESPLNSQLTPRLRIFAVKKNCVVASLRETKQPRMRE